MRSQYRLGSQSVEVLAVDSELPAASKVADWAVQARQRGIEQSVAELELDLVEVEVVAALRLNLDGIDSAASSGTAIDWRQVLGLELMVPQAVGPAVGCQSSKRHGDLETACQRLLVGVPACFDTPAVLAGAVVAGGHLDPWVPLAAASSVSVEGAVEQGIGLEWHRGRDRTRHYAAVASALQKVAATAERVAVGDTKVGGVGCRSSRHPRVVDNAAKAMKDRSLVAVEGRASGIRRDSADYTPSRGDLQASCRNIERQSRA